MLIGTEIKNLSSKVSHFFSESEGCSNLHLMFVISVSGFLNVYYHSMIDEGKMTIDEYNIMMKRNCIAHKSL